MKSSTLLAAAAIAATLMLSPVVYAAPAGIHVPVNAMFSKTKIVHFTLSNDSNSPMELRVGSDLVKLDAGKSLEVKLPQGTRILTDSATPNHKAGDLVAVVSQELSGAIVHIR